MTERMAYVSGEWVPERAAKVSVFDRGFTLGDGVYEVVRTYRHRPFRVADHMDRLYRSLRVARIDPGMGADKMQRLVAEAAEINAPLFQADDDFGIGLIVSRGIGGHPLGCGPATVVIAVRMLNWSQYARWYRQGVHLVATSIRRQPPQCLDGKLKTISRIHQELAEIEAAQVDLEATCLLLDLDGNVAENRVANLCIVRSGVLETPTTKNVLRGMTLQTVLELAQSLEIPTAEREIQLYDVYNADEAFLTCTSFCLIPVSKLNGLRICQDQLPGPITRRILQAFGEKVGVDIMGQALRLGGKPANKT
jgi:branched-chain amino acid aminotransferase